MNRAERRRKGIKTKEPVVNLKRTQIQAIKQVATEDAVNKAFLLMLAIPVMVLHDKYGQLMKKEGREERFAQMCLDLYDSYEKGYVTLDDLHQCLWEEAGIRIVKDGVK